MPRRISKRPPAASAYDAGLRLIASRPHSQAEVRRKLLRRGYNVEAIDAAEARLLQAGFLSDRVFAQLYVGRRSRSAGSLKLSAELAARGVDREVAEQAVERLTPNQQLLAAHRLADKLAGNTEYASYRELLHDVGAKLVRRGFTMDVARRAGDGLWRATPPDSPDEPALTP